MVILRFDPRLIIVALITVFGNAYVQYVVYSQINWVSALLVGLVVTAAIPLLLNMKKKR